MPHTIITALKTEAFRPKVRSCIEKYLSLSENQSLTLGFYRNAERYVFGDGNALSLRYDIGSVSKTMTAHLMLYLAERGLVNLHDSISEYLELPKGEYPTVYELLTHTSGYRHITPIEIVLPGFISHGRRENMYENCTEDSVIKALSQRRKKRSAKYSYSDFNYAVLALVAERVSGSRFADLIEDFIRNELNMKNTGVSTLGETRSPKAAFGKKTIEFWKWERENPYVAGGGLVSNIADMLAYIALEIESKEPFILHAHRLCEHSLSDKSDVATCVGWHTYKKSDQLWHVGRVGTFCTSLTFNPKRRVGVAVLGNSVGVNSANVHYLAKMLYNEIKINKIDFDR